MSEITMRKFVTVRGKELLFLTYIVEILKAEAINNLLLPTFRRLRLTFKQNSILKGA